MSVVIPTLNEEGTLAAAVQSVADADEIIVVDGGSSDRTMDLARDLGAQVLSTPACRGLQMAEGAALTRGEWILFLHADSRLEAGACAYIQTLHRNVVGGAFDLRFDDAQVVYRFLEGAIRLRTRALRLPYGDQAIFARRAAYEAAGGMPHLPLMEDVAFVRALGAVEGMNNKLKASIRTSYGFRTARAIKIMLYHKLGELPTPQLAHRFC